MKKFLKYALLLWLVSTLIGAAIFWRHIHMVATYNPIILAARYDTPDNLEEARLQDLRYLRKLTKYDRSFSDVERRKFASSVDDLSNRVASMSAAEFYLGVARSVAIANNGHTNATYRPIYRDFNRIGIKLYWFSDGLFIVRADETHGALVGSRVVAIEGRSVDNVLADLSQYRGGNSSWKRLFSSMMMESPDIMHAAGLAESAEKLTITLQGQDGKTYDEVLSGARVKNPESYDVPAPSMILQPELLSGETKNWTLALDGRTTLIPLYLQKPTETLIAPLENNGRYIRAQSGFGTKEQSVKEFLEASLDGVGDGALDYLVVDYRFNSGGNFLQSMNFAKSAPLKLKEDGNFYIAVGPQTFSAAIVTAAMLKYYGGDKSVIVGTPMGDDAQFWAERGMNFVLPNSGLNIYYATAYHDWENGCGDHPYCYTFNRMYGVPAGSLAPEATIEPTFAEYASGRDVVMEWIVADHGPPEEIDSMKLEK